MFEALLAQSEAWGTLSARADVVSLLKARMKRSELSHSHQRCSDGVHAMLGFIWGEGLPLLRQSLHQSAQTHHRIGALPTSKQQSVENDITEKYFFLNSAFAAPQSRFLKMSGIHLWLREEVKEHEKRTALTPENCQKLLAKGNRHCSF